MTENIHQELATALLKAGLDHGCLNDWSYGFLENLKDREGYLSKRQWECLSRIAAVVQEEERIAERVAQEAAQ